MALKSELEAENYKLKKQRSILKTALEELRIGARETVAKGNSNNPVWIIEKCTVALTKDETA